MPLNQGSFLHSYRLAKAGDLVKKDQLLADNYFTQGGTLAIGRNLNTAIMPYFGRGFEEELMISDAADKCLTSEHLYDLSRALDPRMTVSPGRTSA